MTIFRNKRNRMLYYIEHLIHDIRFTNCNALAGIYAYPYNISGEHIKFLSRDKVKCDMFIDDNFYIVAIQ